MKSNSIIVSLIILALATNCVNNKSSEELFKIGLEEYEKNNIDTAIEYFDKAIDKDPDNPNPYNSRGTIKIFNGDTSGALYDYSKAVELSMKKGEHAVFPQAYYNRGVLYSMLGEPDKAINDLNISIRQDNNCSKCYYNRGIVRNELGLTKEAYEDFSQAYELNNQYYGAILWMGNIKQYTNDYKGSLVDYNKAIEIDPTKEIAYFRRALSNYYLQEYDHTLADCDLIIKISPNYAVAFTLKGDTQYQLNHMNEACELWNMASELNEPQGYSRLMQYCK